MTESEFTDFSKRELFDYVCGDASPELADRITRQAELDDELAGKIAFFQLFATNAGVSQMSDEAVAVERDTKVGTARQLPDAVTPNDPLGSATPAPALGNSSRAVINSYLTWWALAAIALGWGALEWVAFILDQYTLESGRNR